MAAHQRIILPTTAPEARAALRFWSGPTTAINGTNHLDRLAIERTSPALIARKHGESHSIVPRHPASRPLPHCGRCGWLSPYIDTTTARSAARVDVRIGSLEFGRVRHEPVGELVRAGEGYVVAAVDLVRFDAQALPSMAACPLRGEHAVVAA